jgi:hypothetical protein
VNGGKERNSEGESWGKRCSEAKSDEGKKLREVNRMKEGSLEGESLIFVNLECDINF